MIFPAGSDLRAVSVSVLMRMELQEPGLQIFPNGHAYNVVVAARRTVAQRPAW